MGLFNRKNSESKKNREVSLQKLEEEKSEVFVLKAGDVALGLRAEDKTDAIEQMGDYLVKNGRVSSEYTYGMIEREKEVSTYLMNGVAIPHGVGEAKKFILDSGIFIAQFPEGVEWNEQGDMVYLACALASSSNAHLDVLAKLTMVVQDSAEVEKLVKTSDVQFVLDVFSKDTKDESATAVEIKGKTKTIIFTGENGMHARPATFLAKMAGEYKDTDLQLHANNKSAKAKSMPSILKLGIAPQTEVIVSADGPQADAALERLVRYIEDELNHEKAYKEEDDSESIYDPVALEENSITVEGVKASPGVAVGNIFKLEVDEFDLVERAADKETELELYQKAKGIAIEQIRSLKEEMKAEGLIKESDIVEGHIMSIEDEPIVDSVKENIEAGYSAAFSVSEVYEKQAILLEQLEDAVLRARAMDMRDIRIRLLRIIEHKNETQSLPTENPFILVAEELTPTQTASLNKHPVLGICTALGGATSHMAILARALGLPAIVGMGESILKLEHNQTIIIDAQTGRAITNPSDDLVAKAKGMAAKYRDHQKKEEAEAHLEAVTEDGIKIDVFCNIANSADSAAVFEKGGEGVGLFRTEFLFENEATQPSVETQYNALVEVAKAMKDATVIVRVMDIGGDKPVSWLKLPKEENPFLGVRGIRLLLRNPEIFRDQLRAIYKAAIWQRDNGHKVGFWIMIPMIARTSEYLRAKTLAEEVQKELGAPPLPIGVMIETPSAALIMQHLGKEADFFSIGTNDLTQYTLAMDRVHPELTKEADGLHPSVLMLIDMTVRGGNRHKKHVGVCGNMAADPVMLTALVALGVREVSVSPANVASVKYLIRRLNTKELVTLYEQILDSGSGTEVRSMCEDYFKNNLVHKL